MTTVIDSVKSFFKKVAWIVAIILVLIILFFSFFHYSDGDRAGTIIKISNRGYLLKTWEGELNMGMVITESGGAAVGAQNNIWHFSVKDNEDLVNKIKEANKTGKRVQLHYKELYFKLPWKGETTYIVTDISLTEVTDSVIH